MTTMNEFLDAVDPDIFERGRDYFENGHIRSLEQVGTLAYRAMVRGFETYQVDVELDVSGHIASLDCDCPYDLGPMCKHEVAVLLRLLRELNPMEESEDDTWVQMDQPRQSSTTDLEQELRVLSKDRLIQLLLDLATDSEAVASRIRVRVSRSEGQQEIDEIRELIQSYVEAQEDNFGFVSYRGAWRAVQGVELAADKAKGAVAAGDWLRALRIELCILEAMIDLMGRVDDSDGSVGGEIDEGIERVRQICQGCSSEDVGERLTGMLLEESTHSRWSGWSDWSLDLMECASYLARSPHLRQVWENFIAERTPAPSTTRKDYATERLIQMRHRLIQAMDGSDAAKAYRRQYLHVTEFREMAIREAMKQEQYEEAIRLAMEGEQQDQKLPGLWKGWVELHYQAAVKAGRVDSARNCARSLLLNGDFHYYDAFKNQYDDDEWPVALADLIRDLECRSWRGGVYSCILVSEKLWDRLLAFVQQDVSLIEEYAKALFPTYPVEVTTLYHDHIQWRSKQANNRSGYQAVCRIIRKFAKVVGRAEASSIVQELMDGNRRRPAFLDELSSLERELN